MFDDESITLETEGWVEVEISKIGLADWER
jgi:hypothetical protein